MVLANSADPEQSAPEGESDHSLHCLSFLWAFWSTIWLTFIKPGIQVLPNFVVSFVIMTYISHSSAFVNVNMNFSVCLVYNTSLSIACLYQIGVWLYWLKITELLDCALVGVCAVISLNTYWNCLIKMNAIHNMCGEIRKYIYQGYPKILAGKNIWVPRSENISLDLCLVKIQISLHIHTVWSESSLGTFWIAKGCKVSLCRNKNSE